MHELQWKFKSFEQLSAHELYTLLQLRNEVFIVEQHCVYQDLDDKDQQSFHLCGWLNDALVAYARIIPQGIAFEEVSIGRVCTSPSYRKNGAGRILMQHAIELALKQFNVSEIKIGAQLYLDAFYASLGFRQSGKEYIEDGIPHIPMLFSK